MYQVVCMRFLKTVTVTLFFSACSSNTPGGVRQETLSAAPQPVKQALKKPGASSSSVGQAATLDANALQGTVKDLLIQGDDPCETGECRAGSTKYYGLKTCEDFDFYEGILQCKGCEIDPSNCTKRCGDGEIHSQYGEQCDWNAEGDLFLPGQSTCKDFGYFDGSGVQSPQSYIIESSDDDVNWTTRSTVTDGPREQNNDIIHELDTPATARYWRMTVYTGYGENRIGLDKMEWHGY